LPSDLSFNESITTMPFYEYECQNCKFYTELMQKISDPPLEKCPSCGKKAMQKLISAPVFRLKGSGWYETDFKGDGENKRNLAGADQEESKATASAEESSATKTDAKSDTKSDAKPAAAETKSTPAEAKTARTSGGKSPGRAAVAAAKGGHKKSASKPAARSASRAPAKARSKAKSKGKAGKKGRR
jgi:putative FmdB family regulatory protein